MASRSCAWLDMRLALGVEELEAAEDIETYVQSLVASRVALGTASWSESLRYHLGLRQARSRYQHAEAVLKMRDALNALKAGSGD